MNMSRGDFLRIALSPALGLAILLSGVPTWGASDTVTHPNPPPSSDVAGPPPDHEALVDEIVSRFEGGGQGITVTKVPASEVTPGSGETAQDAFVIKFAGKPPTSINPKSDGIDPLQQLMQAAAVAKALTEKGVIVTFDPLPADPNAIDPDAIDSMAHKADNPALEPQRPDCWLTESDWARCFDKKVAYPDWYKAYLSDDAWRNEIRTQPPPSFKFRNFSSGLETRMLAPQ